MLDEKEFADIKKAFKAFDEKREAVIKESRDILKLSKQAIYSVHRGDISKAEEQLKAAEKIRAELDKQIDCDHALKTGGFANALEEYVEAKVFLSFMQDGTIDTMSSLAVCAEAYLGGLADLTGELCRQAVLLATKNDAEKVSQIHAAIEEIYGQFVQFDFRNGELRRKYDSIKYNLQKVERVLYDLTMRVNGDE
jgi:predicted translin family RNA/ssDNA-binding protein